MTIDSERWSNIKWTRLFLLSIIDTDDCPLTIRKRARQLLKHYPEDWWVEQEQKARKQ